MQQNRFKKPEIKKKEKKAFTLVETLVAIAILLIAVVEPLSIVAGSVATANLAKDQVLAYYLAQEGVELIRNVRDTNVLKTRDWLYGLDNCAPTGGNFCQFDFNVNPESPTGPAAITTCLDNSGSPCATLNKIPTQDSNGKIFLYSYQTGTGSTATTFQRLIRVEETTNDREVEVTVRMKWRTGSLYGTGKTDRTFEIKERMFNWNS